MEALNYKRRQNQKDWALNPLAANRKETVSPNSCEQFPELHLPKPNVCMQILCTLHIP